MFLTPTVRTSSFSCEARSSIASAVLAPGPRLLPALESCWGSSSTGKKGTARTDSHLHPRCCSLPPSLLPFARDRRENWSVKSEMITPHLTRRNHLLSLHLSCCLLHLLPVPVSSLSVSRNSLANEPSLVWLAAAACPSLALPFRCCCCCCSPLLLTQLSHTQPLHSQQQHNTQHTLSQQPTNQPAMSMQIFVSGQQQQHACWTARSFEIFSLARCSCLLAAVSPVVLLLSSINQQRFHRSNLLVCVVVL